MKVLAFDCRLSLTSSDVQNQFSAMATSANDIQRHSGILGLSGLVKSMPYAVPSWIPPILVDLSRHTKFIEGSTNFSKDIPMILQQWCDQQSRTLSQNSVALTWTIGRSVLETVVWTPIQTYMGLLSPELENKASLQLNN